MRLVLNQESRSQKFLIPTTSLSPLDFHRFIDKAVCLLADCVGELGIERGSLWAFMPQLLLYRPQIQTGLYQMCAVTMAQAVRCDGFANAAVFYDNREGVLALTTQCVNMLLAQ